MEGLWRVVGEEVEVAVEVGVRGLRGRERREEEEQELVEEVVMGLWITSAKSLSRSAPRAFRGGRTAEGAWGLVICRVREWGCGRRGERRGRVGMRVVAL